MVFHKLPVGQNMQILIGIVCVCGVGAAPLYGKWGKGYDSMADKKAAMEAEAKIKEAKKQAYNERVK